MYETEESGMMMYYDTVDGLLGPQAARAHGFFEPDEVRDYRRNREIPQPRGMRYALAVIPPGTKIGSEMCKPNGWGIFVMGNCEKVPDDVPLPWTLVLLATPPKPLYKAYKTAVHSHDDHFHYGSPWSVWIFLSPAMSDPHADEG